MRTIRFLTLMAAVFSISTLTCRAEDMPTLLGYGNRSCDHFVKMWPGVETGVEKDIDEFMRYQDWLAGFVSGLNLATGRDALAGVTLEGALGRIRLYCVEHRKDDFFSATMDLVRILSPLR